ncbi:MAG: hypothetical protein RR980_05825 [Mucinivorans sp.]
MIRPITSSPKTKITVARKLLITMLLALGSYNSFALCAQPLAEPLAAYDDYLATSSDFSLSFLRFSRGGLSAAQSELRINGVLINDPQTGTPPWAALGRLESASTASTQNRGLYFTINQAGIGGVGGGRYLEIRPSHQTSTGSVTGSFSNRTYTTNLGASYTLLPGKGWGATFCLDKGGGRSLTTQGVWADRWSAIAAIEKQINPRHHLQLSLIAAPTNRAMAAPASDEAFSLAGENLYNPSWGMYGEKVRSTRVRQTVEPIAIIDHRWAVDSTLTLSSAIMVRLGRASSSSLEWQNAPNPLPDYWGAMPSAQTTPEMASQLARLWRTDQGVRQINFDHLTSINTLNGARAHYAIQDKVNRTRQLTIQSTLAGRNFTGGLSATFLSRTSYKEMSDLLGGDYWLDVDSFIEMDDDTKDLTQNNLRQPNRHIRTGECFGYNYILNTFVANLWGAYSRRWDRWALQVGGSLSPKVDQRIGLYEKENFPTGRSFGASRPIVSLDGALKVMGSYLVGSKLELALSVAYFAQHEPSEERFISPEFRNATNPELGAASVFAAQLVVNYRRPTISASGGVFYNQTIDGSQLHDQYDDLRHVYVHYSMQGIATRAYGLYGAVEVNLPLNLSIAAAVDLQSNTYSSNPVATEYAQSTGEKLVGEQTVFYRGRHTALAPLFAGTMMLAWRPRGWVVSLTAVGQVGAYVLPSPLRRTYDALSRAASPQAMHQMMEQEKLPDLLTLNLFAGRSWYFNKGQSVGIYCGANNILNNRNIKSVGYESSRLRNLGSSYRPALVPHASKYYHATGINFFVNVTYRF